jgi:hypothetical protein
MLRKIMGLGERSRASMAFEKDMQAANYTVLSIDNSKMLSLGGHACFTVTFGPPAKYSSSFFCFVQNTDVPTHMTVTGAAAGNSGVIRLSVNSTTAILSGDTVIVQGVTGTTEANGYWIVNVIDATQIELQGSTFANAYLSSGDAIYQGRAKIINLNGNSVFLWPGYGGVVGISQANWYNTFPARFATANTVITKNNRHLPAITLFVDPTGSDRNDGLALGAAGALLNIQTGIDRIHNSIDSGGFQNHVKLADGTYNVRTGVQIVYAQPQAQIYIIGNAANPANVTVSCSANERCFDIEEPATVTLVGMTLATSGSGSTGVFVRQFATCDLQEITN